MNFAPEERLSTPYVKAGQVWDARIGTVRAQAYSWRLAAFASMFVALVAVIGLIYQSSKASVVPYVVEIDEVGKTRLVGTPTTQNWEPRNAIKHYFLEQWIRQVRSVSSDTQVLRQDWLKAYAGVTQDGKAQLDEFVREFKPFERSSRGEKRTVEIKSTNEVSTSSFRVEWVEREFSANGFEEKATYVGVFELQRSQPRDAETLKRNPLGLYVNHLSWAKESTTTAGETP